MTRPNANLSQSAKRGNPTVHVSIGKSHADQRGELSEQVTTLISKHEEALAQGPVSEQDTFKNSNSDHRQITGLTFQCR